MNNQLKGDIITQITDGGTNVQSMNTSNTFAGKLDTSVNDYRQVCVFYFNCVNIYKSFQI